MSATEAEVYFQYRQVGSTEWIDTSIQGFSSPSSFAESLSDLDTGTEYEYRTVAEAYGQTDHGSIIRFVPRETGDEEITDAYASNVSAFSATLNAGWGDGPSDLVHVWYRYRQVGSSTWLETDRYVLDEPGPIPGGDITDLQDDTEYEWQARIETYVQDHAVSTGSPTDIGLDSVTLHGDLTDLYGPPSTNVGFVYGPDGSDLSSPESNADVEEVEVTSLEDPGSFDLTVDGLDDDTTYDHLAYSEAPILIGATDIDTFRTEPALGVEAITATNLSGGQATLRGSATYHAFDTAEFSVEYREQGTSSWTQSSSVTLSSTGEYEIDISGLTEGASYEWRARADKSSEGRTVTSDTLTFTAGSSADINLVHEVPNRAWNIYQNAPGDIREDLDRSVVPAVDYDGRSGDLAELIETASRNGDIVDLGSGTYELRSAVTNTGDFLAIAGDGAEVYVDRPLSSGIAFHLGGAGAEHEVYLQDWIFDVSEQDCAFLTTFSRGIRDYFFAEDIRQRGERDSYQGGHKMNFLVQMQSGGESFIHRCSFPDGDHEVNGVDDDYAIGGSADDAHNGYNVFKECEWRHWNDNGLYVLAASETGPNVIWDCTFVNNARGNVRIGHDDIIIGGRAEVNSNFRKSEQPGSFFAHNYHQFDRVVGLTMVGAGNGWGMGGIQTWGSAEGGTMRDCVFHVKSGNSIPIRVDSGNGVHFNMENMWILDEHGGPRTFSISDAFNQSGSVTLGSDIRIDSNATNTFQIGSQGTLTAPNGTTYSGTSVDASDIGVAANLTENDLPTLHFDYSER